MKVAAQILFHARTAPERPAIVHGGAIVTYGILGRGVATACGYLRRQGLPPGAAVAIQIANPIHHVALILAAELCGMTSLSIQTFYALGEAGVGIDAVLIDTPDTPVPDTPTIMVSEEWFVLAPSVPLDLRGGVAEDRYYRIILSSGTTGRQKAIGYKPALVGRYLLRATIMGAESRPRNLNMFAFSTIGFFAPILNLAVGGTIFFAAAAEEALRLIRVYEIARLGFVGVIHLEALVAAARVSGDAYPSLTAIQVSGSKVPLDLAAEARARLCNNVIVSFGSTEAGILSYGRFGTPGLVEGGAGFVLPWVEVEAASADGRPLRRGAEGPLRVKGPDMAEYVLPPGASGQIDPNDWFHPGDIGYVRDDGLLVVTGRTSEVINRRGIIVAPDYIEKVLEADARVQAAGVFVHQNAAGLEEIWAAVVPHGEIDLDDVRRKSHAALGDKTPDRIEIVDALPRTETGKLKRVALRQRFSLTPVSS